LIGPFEVLAASEPVELPELPHPAATHATADAVAAAFTNLRFIASTFLSSDHAASA
jgi:hypothetical protein